MALMLFISVPLIALQDKQESGNQEVSGKIKDFSIAPLDH